MYTNYYTEYYLSNYIGTLAKKEFYVYFEIQRSLDGINYVYLARTQLNTTGYTDSGLSSNTMYYYRVRATAVINNITEYSDWEYASATTE